MTAVILSFLAYLFVNFNSLPPLPCFNSAAHLILPTKGYTHFIGFHFLIRPSSSYFFPVFNPLFGLSDFSFCLSGNYILNAAFELSSLRPWPCLQQFSPTEMALVRRWILLLTPSLLFLLRTKEGGNNKLRFIKKQRGGWQGLLWPPNLFWSADPEPIGTRHISCGYSSFRVWTEVSSQNTL